MYLVLLLAAIASVSLRTRKPSTATRRADLAIWTAAALACTLLTGTVSAAPTAQVVLSFMAAYVWHKKAFPLAPAPQPVPAVAAPVEGPLTLAD